jgi:hypothetical protein
VGDSDGLHVSAVSTLTPPGEDSDGETQGSSAKVRLASNEDRTNHMSSSASPRVPSRSTLCSSGFWTASVACLRRSSGWSLLSHEFVCFHHRPGTCSRVRRLRSRRPRVCGPSRCHHVRIARDLESSSASCSRPSSTSFAPRPASNPYPSAPWCSTRVRPAAGLRTQRQDSSFWSSSQMMCAESHVKDTGS